MYELRYRFEKGDDVLVDSIPSLGLAMSAAASAMAASYLKQGDLTSGDVVFITEEGPPDDRRVEARFVWSTNRWHVETLAGKKMPWR